MDIGYMYVQLQATTRINQNFLTGLPTTRSDRFNFIHHVHPLHNFSEDDVFTIQMTRFGGT